MVLDDVLAAAGDEDELLDSRFFRFLDRVLDHRLVDDRQHLLRHRLGRGQEARAHARDGKDGFADGSDFRHGGLRRETVLHGILEAPSSTSRESKVAMNVLITGGAGFIGFHATRALLARGHAITAVDELNAYYDPALKRARLAEIGTSSSYRFVQTDIAAQGALAEAAGTERFDIILHLAAQAG